MAPVAIRLAEFADVPGMAVIRACEWDTEPYRLSRIAGQPMGRVGEWFVAQNLRRICVDVEPENLVARVLYSRHGAGHLNRHWMVWEHAERMCARPR